MNSNYRILTVFAAILCYQLLSVNCATRPRPIRDFVDYNAREDGDKLISLPSGPVPSYIVPFPGGRTGSPTPSKSNLSRRVLSRRVRSNKARSRFTSDVRLVKDFVDYNAREDGDHMIALPSGGPSPVYALRPLISKPGYTDNTRDSRGKANRQRVYSKNNSNDGYELRYRDESGRGGRRGN